MHQQAQLALLHDESEEVDITRGVDPKAAAGTFTLDRTFTPNPAHMVTGIELRDGKLYEVDLEPGARAGVRRSTGR